MILNFIIARISNFVKYNFRFNIYSSFLYLPAFKCEVQKILDKVLLIWYNATVVRKVLLHILSLYFVLIGFSPLWGLHAHDLHEHHTIFHVHELELEETDNHSHEKELPLLPFEHIFTDKSFYSIGNVFTENSFIKLQFETYNSLFQTDEIVKPHFELMYSAHHHRDDTYSRFAQKLTAPRPPPIQ